MEPIHIVIDHPSVQPIILTMLPTRTIIKMFYTKIILRGIALLSLLGNQMKLLFLIITSSSIITSTRVENLLEIIILAMNSLKEIGNRIIRKDHLRIHFSLELF